MGCLLVLLCNHVGVAQRERQMRVELACLHVRVMLYYALPVHCRRLDAY